MAGVREEEFDEGDVWDMLQGGDHQTAAGEVAALVGTPPRSRRDRSTGKDKKKAPGVAKSDGATRRSSAPVAIPAGGGSSSRRGGGEEEEEDGGEMLPPHEWLARKMERMGVASSPPDETCRGRSKGRELAKVRDAVLPKTAFSDHQ
ncbi:hypothetical protein HU200_051358 [Digitaria exilis]|uniref:Uncharacterized protein n=1 Tax=Digitaria exilis TaxID=1010633 RepID=A0A835E6W1_9POAL|nr:hypothetical protein HU200_051358 [Digitaria exilis]